jgi:hypothetical protein
MPGGFEGLRARGQGAPGPAPSNLQRNNHGRPGTHNFTGTPKYPRMGCPLFFRRGQAISLVSIRKFILKAPFPSLRGGYLSRRSNLLLNFYGKSFVRLLRFARNDGARGVLETPWDYFTDRLLAGLYPFEH